MSAHVTHHQAKSKSICRSFCFSCKKDPLAHFCHSLLSGLPNHHKNIKKLRPVYTYF